MPSDSITQPRRLPFFLSLRWCVGLAALGAVLGLVLMTLVPVSALSEGSVANQRRLQRFKAMLDECGKNAAPDSPCVLKHWLNGPLE